MGTGGPSGLPQIIEPAPLTHEPLAHLDEAGRPHLLIDHLRAVADLAAHFGQRLGASEWARLAGLWHDLGKYAANFQVMIREANGFAAHIEGDVSGPRDHSSAGAIHTLDALGQQGAPIAFAIAGHHAGLPNLVDLQDRCSRKRERYDSAKRGGAPPDLLAAAAPAYPEVLRQGSLEEQRRRLEMWTRMLFSALCDADFLDTEAFYDAARAASRGGGPAIEILRERLAAHLRDLQARADDIEVNRVRADVLRACLEAAQRPPGAFSLTVPTGGGKTLTSMAFALEHAAAHRLDRVVVAIPFTSIIEQTAAVLGDALGDDAVIEHHSALDPSRETPRNRIASENWDAPVIVTTTVQLFESLLANRPSACRKLHRLARSVIILDEAQTLPPSLLEPTLDVLRALLRDFGGSLVICTATQPALGRAHGLASGLEAISEIVPQEVRAFERLRRVRVRWPAAPGPADFGDLAREIARERDVLAIVHRRSDARSLCEALDAELGHEDTLHLSALMCAEHRSRVLADIKTKKRAGTAVRLVATQLVEAGVDLDFAVVYRALGGLDALAQAAGRCNREGRLDGLGELRVFLAPTAPPPGVPRAALAVTRALLEKDPNLDLFAPDTHRAYFRELYGTRDLDFHKIQQARAKLEFADVAQRYRLIEDDWSAPVVIAYDARATRCLRDLEKYGPSLGRLRLLQRYTVAVPRMDREQWIATGAAREVAGTVVVLAGAFMAAYDNGRFGLLPDRVGIAGAASLVIDG